LSRGRSPPGRQLAIRGGFEKRFDAFALLGGDERADLRLIARRIADDDRFSRGDEAGDEFIVRLALHEHAAARTAILPGVGENAHRRLRRGFLQVGVREDDVRRLAPQLEADAFDVAGGELHDARADLGRAGEGDFSHERMRNEGFADFAARARQYLKRARRKPRLVRDRGEHHGRHRRWLGGLEDDTVSRRQRRRDLPTRDRKREIPRHDRGDHAERLAKREIESAGGDGNRLSAEFSNRARVILEDLRPKRDLVAGVSDRLADALHVDLRQPMRHLANAARDGEEDLCAFSGRHVTPGLVERALRPAYRAIDIIARRARNLRERLLRRRIDQRDAVPVAAARVAVDKGTVPDHHVIASR
jgi:ParB family chromosome partitioning protein